MKTTILQLETYDSRQSILEKLARVNGGRIILVWPKRGNIDLSEADLVLIERAAENGSISLALVSHSAQVIDLAKAHKINCYESIPAAEHARWVKRNGSSFKQIKPGIANFDDLTNKPKWPVPTQTVQRIIFWSSVLLSGLAILALFLFLLPSATVILTPQKNEKTIEIQVWGSQKFTTVNINGNIPLLQKKIEVSNSIIVPASGKVAIPDAFATAVVEFTNLTSQDLLVPAGTVVSTDSDPIVRFVTDTDITLGVGSDSTSSVSVKAVAPGSQGNVASNAIQIVEGSLGGWLEVTNPEPAAGGFDSEAPSPSEEDYQAAKTSLLTKLKEQAQSTFSHETDFQPIPASITVSTETNETRSVEVGQPGDQATLTLTVTATCLGFSMQDLKVLANEIFLSSLQPGEALYNTDPIISSPESFTSDGEGGYKWVVKASSPVGAKIDTIQVARYIAGQRYSDSDKYLQDLYKLERSPQYRSFLAPFRLPWAAFRITVEVE